MSCKPDPTNPSIDRFYWKQSVPGFVDWIWLARLGFCRCRVAFRCGVKSSSPVYHSQRHQELCFTIPSRSVCPGWSLSPAAVQVRRSAAVEASPSPLPFEKPSDHWHWQTVRLSLSKRCLRFVVRATWTRLLRCLPIKLCVIFSLCPAVYVQNFVKQLKNNLHFWPATVQKEIMGVVGG